MPRVYTTQHLHILAKFVFVQIFFGGGGGGGGGGGEPQWHIIFFHPVLFFFFFFFKKKNFVFCIETQSTIFSIVSLFLRPLYSVQSFIKYSSSSKYLNCPFPMYSQYLREIVLVISHDICIFLFHCIWILGSVPPNCSV